MTMLDDLAQAAGVARHWHDARQQRQTVSDETLIAVLNALGYPAQTESRQRDSLHQIATQNLTPPSLITGEIGQPIALPSALAHAHQADLLTEQDQAASLTITAGHLPALHQPGYHRLTIHGHALTLAIAPPRCPPLATTGQKRWGVAVQVPSLRASEGSAYGTLADLPSLITVLARHGADAVAISPVHALFPGDGLHFSPYSPSSRLFLNGALASPVPDTASDGLIDWTTAVPRQFARMQADYAGLSGAQRNALALWAQEQGPALHRHALFNVLRRQFGGLPWQQWPSAFRDPAGEAARQSATSHAEEIGLHLFIQQQAQQALTQAQHTAKAHGMGIGLIADLAVGVDPGGSDAWSFGKAMLRGLTIGAPPDPLGPLGQNWSLTSFSPQGLRATGFAPFIAMLRAALAHAGGLRIDHAFGLERLWVVPEGLSAGQGTYLSYPRTDLLRIITLEAHRANATIIAEDLGTHPPGFSQAIEDRGMAGMRVLWFERDKNGGFRPPASFAPLSVAMTGTHDTPTVAGWWRGRDLAWDRALRRRTLPALAMAETERMVDRAALWAAMEQMPPPPAPEVTAPVVDAALEHIGKAASALAIVPLEDVLGLEEQPNLPGTSTQHPNWRRRLPAPFEDLAARPAIAARLDLLNRSRRA
ncbi:4-alpha-glucanotransferase [Novosphingobium terrae]|uniref:4-alpha-glucanotransferase n=1 Tax=Novosphingobium terrae TaxID=2726189 RepID=UPI001981ECFF|nr:4-alpha-glucanotransferase [Novosphingobium terrae]